MGNGRNTRRVRNKPEYPKQKQQQQTECRTKPDGNSEK